MELKLFGKSIFSWRKETGILLCENVESTKEKSEFIPDFYKARGNVDSFGQSYVVIESLTSTLNQPAGAVAVPVKPEDKKEDEPMGIKITPKGVYELKLLNEESFEIKVDPEYVDSQIADFKDKLSMLKKVDWDMRHGVDELASILLRMENRKHYSKHHDFFSQFPYTMTARIDEVVKTHDHLQLGHVAQFMADMPKDATKTMKDYNGRCKEICDKQAVFYIIADKKDFKKTNTRRDPILLAQSPFGHFWQILGAWDKEMLLLEEL